MEMGGDSSLFQPETLRHLVETMIFNQLGIKIYIYICILHDTYIGKHGDSNPWDLSSKNTVTNTPFRTGMEKPSTIGGFFSKNNGGFRAWNLESGLLKWVPVETQQVSRFQMQFPFLHDLYVSLTRCEYAQPNHLQVNMSEP